jgi:hypothetical protein
LLEEKKNYYTIQENEFALKVIHDEEQKLNHIGTKIKLMNVYRDADSPFFFKRSKLI